MTFIVEHFDMSDMTGKPRRLSSHIKYASCNFRRALHPSGRALAAYVCLIAGARRASQQARRADGKLPEEKVGKNLECGRTLSPFLLKRAKDTDLGRCLRIVGRRQPDGLKEGKETLSPPPPSPRMLYSVLIKRLVFIPAFPIRAQCAADLDDIHWFPNLS